MIRDAHGRKMSKSLGNVIDPLEVIKGITRESLHKRLEEGNLDPIELQKSKKGQVRDFPNGISECGADALRFALVSFTAQFDKINLDIQRVVGYRQWCNKLWNAIRFAMGKLGDDYIPPGNVVPKVMPFSCQWILSVLNKAISKTVLSLDAFEFSDAATAIYHWWQFQLCDVFIEVIKPYFASDDPKFLTAKKFAQDTLWVCLDNGLRLLHPFMPYVTEELWQRLPAGSNYERKESIVICDYPATVEVWESDDIESEMDLVLSVVRCLRSLLPANEKYERHKGYLLCRQPNHVAVIKHRELEILTLASLSTLEVLMEIDGLPARCAVDVVDEKVCVFLELHGPLSVEAEREKLERKMEETQKQQDALEKTMNALGYKEKVLPHIHEENEEKLASFELKIQSFKAVLHYLDRE